MIVYRAADSVSRAVGAAMRLWPVRPDGGSAPAFG